MPVSQWISISHTVVSAGLVYHKHTSASERAIPKHQCLNGSQFRTRWYQQTWYIINMLVPVKYSLTILQLAVKKRNFHTKSQSQSRDQSRSCTTLMNTLATVRCGTPNLSHRSLISLKFPVQPCQSWRASPGRRSYASAT